jgi:hypothetical protein
VEVSVDQIRSNFSYLSFVGAIFLHPDHTLEFQLFHEPLYRLVVDDIATVSHFKSYPPVAVAALIFMEYRSYLFFLDFVFVRSSDLLKVVVICASWY